MLLFVLIDIKGEIEILLCNCVEIELSGKAIKQI